MVISFLRVWTDGDRRTDTVLESSYGNMSAHKKFKLKTSGELLIFMQNYKQLYTIYVIERW